MVALCGTPLNDTSSHFPSMYFYDVLVLRSGELLLMKSPNFLNSWYNDGLEGGDNLQKSQQERLEEMNHS